jgi:hypothetical protein
MIRVEPLSPPKEAEYREFLLRDSRSLLYASVEYRDFLARAVGGAATYLLALDEQERIIGALPYFCLEAPGYGKVINSLPWYGSHGGCIVAADRASEARRALLEQYRRAVDAPNVLSATLILAPGEEVALAEYRNILTPSVEDRRIGQMTPLPTSSDRIEDQLMSVLLQKTRNLVRKSLKQGFALLERDDDSTWRFLFETHVENMQAVGGKYKPWSHFLAMREALPANSRRLLVAELDGLPVAALLLLYFNRTVEYVTPVIKHDYRSRQPLSFLIWHGMVDAIRSGYLWWNWGGTWVTQVSLHHFKAGWGAVDLPYTYLINSSPAGRAVLSANRTRLGELFPFFYTYPYDKL